MFKKALISSRLGSYNLYTFDINLALTKIDNY